MSRHPKRTPSLEDALEKGFSELKVGESNLMPVEPNVAPQEANSEDQPTQPILYNQKFEAVEDREEFVVSNPVVPAESNEEEAKKAIDIVNEASSSIGDEFDVEW